MVRFTSVAAFAAVLGLSVSFPVVRMAVSPEPYLFFLEATPASSWTPYPSITPGASRIPRAPPGVTPGASPSVSASVAPEPPTVTPGLVPGDTPTPASQAAPSQSAPGPTGTRSIPSSAPGTSPASNADAGSASVPGSSPVVFPNEPSLAEASPLAEATPGSAPTSAPVCFPARATVELENGSRKTMEQIQLGDRVKVADGVFSDVFMFTHKLSEVLHEFVSIKTNTGAALSLTEGHYLYVNGHLSPARVVKSGDALELGDGSKTVVTSVEIVKARGLFNPQTTHGDIIVDGVKSSTYTTAVTPGAAHALLAPVRSMYERFGLTSDFLDAGSARLASMVALVLSN